MSKRYWILTILVIAAAGTAVVLKTRSQHQQAIKTKAETEASTLQVQVRHITSHLTEFDRTIRFNLDLRQPDEQLLKSFRDLLRDLPGGIPVKGCADEEVLGSIDFLLPNARASESIQAVDRENLQLRTIARMKITTIEVIRVRHEDGFGHRMQWQRRRTKSGSATAPAMADEILVPETLDAATFNDLMCKRLVQQLRKSQEMLRQWDN